jgi:predicted nucleic acid-binding protein
MFLIDTNLISEARKGLRVDPGVCAFWADAASYQTSLFLPAVVVGELRRGVDLIHHRGDRQQAHRLEAWLAEVLDVYGDRMLAFDADAAQLWGAFAGARSPQCSRSADCCDRPVARPHARDSEHDGFHSNGRAAAESLSQHKAPAVRPGQVPSRLV